MIRFRNDTHSIWVTAVDGDTVTYADCNFTGKCQIRWDGQLSKTTIQESLSYILSPDQVTPAPDPNPEPDPDPSPFADVKADQFYYTPVLWAVENGITLGVDATHFKPNDSCTRGQVVTFLWRAAGCPAPAGTECPFGDVVPDQYCYQAVLWAYENEIALGVSGNLFNPEGTVTRGQVVTFLWRAMGQPPAETETPSRTFLRIGSITAPSSGLCKAGLPTAWRPGNLSRRTTAPGARVVTFLHRNYG